MPPTAANQATLRLSLSLLRIAGIIRGHRDHLSANVRRELLEFEGQTGVTSRANVLAGHLEIQQYEQICSTEVR